MCLLIAQNPNTIFVLSDFVDFCSKNPDGFGMAVPEGDGVTIYKITPEKKATSTKIVAADEFDDWDNAGTVWMGFGRHLDNNLYDHSPKRDPEYAAKCFKLWEDHAKGKTASLHFRFRTHGDVCDENTHPYPVLTRDIHGEDLYLMHNGTLSTGNRWDSSKSDTWHFAEFLQKVLAGRTELLEDAKFMEYIEHYIGSNRITLTSKRGVKVLNSSQWSRQTVYAALLSNDYAWTKPYTPPQSRVITGTVSTPTPKGSKKKRGTSNKLLLAESSHPIISLFNVASPFSPKTKPNWLTAKLDKYKGAHWADVRFCQQVDSWNFTRNMSINTLRLIYEDDPVGFCLALSKMITDPTLSAVPFRVMLKNSRNYSLLATYEIIAELNILLSIMNSDKCKLAAKLAEYDSIIRKNDKTPQIKAA